MNKLQVYWAGIEYSYTKKSHHFGKLIGGFVYVFVKALNEAEALKRLTDELTQQGLDVKEVEFVSPYNKKTEWETEEQAKIYAQLYKKAKSSNQVIFDDFYAYEGET